MKIALMKTAYIKQILTILMKFNKNIQLCINSIQLYCFFK